MQTGRMERIRSAHRGCFRYKLRLNVFVEIQTCGLPGFASVAPSFLIVHRTKNRPRIPLTRLSGCMADRFLRWHLEMCHQSIKQ